VATNEYNETTEGVEQTFSTRPTEPPSVITEAATNTTQTTTTANGTIDPNGTVTTYQVELGTVVDGAIAYSLVASGDAGFGAGNVPIAAAIAGLQPGTVYYYRLVATNAYGTVQGGDRIFTTVAPQSGPPAPIALPLLEIPPIFFPDEVHMKKLTRVQELKRALKACQKKPKSKRAACRRAAHRKYPIRKTT
jgi:hypothetical protein